MEYTFQGNKNLRRLSKFWTVVFDDSSILGNPESFIKVQPVKK